MGDTQADLCIQFQGHRLSPTLNLTLLRTGENYNFLDRQISAFNILMRNGSIQENECDRQTGD